MARLLDPTESGVDPAMLAGVLDQFQRDVRYLDVNRDAWIADYPDSWVIVYNEQLLCHADTLQQVLEDARTQGIPLETAAIEYLSTNPQDLLL